MTVPVEDFSDPLDQQFGAVERAVEAHRDGELSNVAVVAEPFAGRSALLDYAETVLDEETVERHSLSEPVVGGLPRFGDADAYLVDDCHYLYRREIGGFDALAAFVERMARTDALFVTSWNRYAWTYLVAVRDVDRVFPAVVQVPDFAAAALADVIESIFGPDLPRYVEDGAEGRIKSFEWVRHPVRLWGERTLWVPLLQPNPEYIRSWTSRETAKRPRAIVFEKIRRAAGGNVGVAADLWARSVQDGEIATGHIDVLAPSFDFDHADAMVLRALLAQEELPRGALASTFQDVQIDAVLQHLVEQDVAEVEDDTAMLTPQGLRPAVEELARRRLVW